MVLPSLWGVCSTLPASKPDTYFYFLALLQPSPGIFYLEGAMVVCCFGTQANLFDFDLLLRFSRLPHFFCPLVLEFAMIHHTDNRRFCSRRNLNQIQVGFLR